MTDSLDECRAHIAEMRAERDDPDWDWTLDPRGEYEMTDADKMDDPPHSLYHGMQVPALLVATALKNCHAVAPTYSGDEMTHQDVALYMCRVFQNLQDERTNIPLASFLPAGPSHDFDPHEFLVRCGLTEDVAAFLLLEGGEADSEPTAEQDQREAEALDDLDPYPDKML